MKFVGFSARLAVYGVMAVASLPAASQDEAPEWVRQAAAQAVPTYPVKVSSVVLMREETVVVDVDGRRTMHERGAIRILQRSSETIEAYRTYNTKNGRIRDFQGWLISPAGKSTAYPKNMVVDVALSQSYTYDEGRAKVLECGAAPPGSVFAWEVTEEEKSIFTQDSYQFQGAAPTLLSRFSLTLPAGWDAKGTVFNREKLEPVLAGNTQTWELRDLPWIEREPHSPSLAALAPRVAVSYFPSQGNRAGLQGLKDWRAVSTWLTPLVDPAADVTDLVRAKSAQLTAGLTGETEKIRAIAAFAQQTKYIEVSLNVLRGGGYTPHRAEETMTRNYGDCKDKATLMRALLKAAGIDSYLVTITAGDRYYVRPEWASPMQFNHAIIAVKVSDGVSLPTVIDGGELGRLLIFDPTDPVTGPGDLPQEEQGSQALVVAGDRGVLLKMPVLPAAAGRMESKIAGDVDAAGAVEARVERSYYGQSSIPLRAVQMMRGGAEVQKRFEREFAGRVAGATVGKVQMDVAKDRELLQAKVDVKADRFVQVMQGRLFLVRPGLLTSGGDYVFAPKVRTAPIELEADLRHDSVTLKMPAGLKADEVPGPARLESPYGRLEARWSVQEGNVTLDMTLEIREMTVPASEYGKLREFFEHVSGAQGAAVVLVKQ